MKIYLCHIGKTKTGWIQDGETDFHRKLKRFGTVKTEILSSSKAHDADGHRFGDSQTIRNHLGKAPTAYNILLDERGKRLNSSEFAQSIDKIKLHHGPSIRFITGGPYGVSDDIRAQCDKVLRLSEMVMPHELIRVVLMEQIYRAFTILRGESYHHI